MIDIILDNWPYNYNYYYNCNNSFSVAKQQKVNCDRWLEFKSKNQILFNPLFIYFEKPHDKLLVR